MDGISIVFLRLPFGCVSNNLIGKKEKEKKERERKNVAPELLEIQFNYLQPN